MTYYEWDVELVTGASLSLSSFVLSCSFPGPVVDIVDHSVIGTTVTGCGAIGECGRLSQPNWLFSELHCVSKKFSPLNSL